MIINDPLELLHRLPFHGVNRSCFPLLHNTMVKTLPLFRHGKLSNDMVGMAQTALTRIDTLQLQVVSRVGV